MKRSLTLRTIANWLTDIIYIYIYSYNRFDLSSYPSGVIPLTPGRSMLKYGPMFRNTGVTGFGVFLESCMSSLQSAFPSELLFQNRAGDLKDALGAVL